MAVTSSDVLKIWGPREPELSTDQQDELLAIAQRLADDVFGGRISRLAEIEGDQDDFTKYLTAHLWQLSSGGEVQSSSQTGGNVTFQHLQSNFENTLSETRFGRICLLMMRHKASIGIVRRD